MRTRINGEVVRRGNPNPNPYVQRKNRKADPNGLNQFLDDDNLNEVKRVKKVEPVPEEPENDINTQVLNESSKTYKEVDIITSEMWYNWCEASIYPLAVDFKNNIKL